MFVQTQDDGKEKLEALCHFQHDMQRSGNAVWIIQQQDIWDDKQGRNYGAESYGLPEYKCSRQSVTVIVFLLAQLQTPTNY